jgi:hypothetical protein
VFEPQTLFDNIVRHHVSQASENTASMSDWVILSTFVSLCEAKTWVLLSATEYISQYLSCIKYLQHLYIFTYLLIHNVVYLYLLLSYLIIFYLIHINLIIINYIWTQNIILSVNYLLIKYISVSYISNYHLSFTHLCVKYMYQKLSLLYSIFTAKVFI